MLGDSFYGTYFLLASMIEKDVGVGFEQHGSRKRITDFRKGKKLGSKDHIILIPKPKIKPDWMSKEIFDSSPSSIKIRELEVSGKILITTLLSPKQASKSELKALYKQRWQVELDLRNIKTTLGMETLSCKTPEMNRKEICRSLIGWINDGSHSITDDLYIELQADAIDKYLKVFKDIFVLTKHEEHYNMMII